jgi:hypothetical protein
MDLGFSQRADADLGALQVLEDGYRLPRRVRDVADGGNQGSFLVVVAVREVEAADVDACVDQAALDNRD